MIIPNTENLNISPTRGECLLPDFFSVVTSHMLRFTAKITTISDTDIYF